MDKATIAEVLEKIATLLELKGENPFKIRAYTNAARSIETFGGNLGDLKDEEILEKIPGVGKAIAAKIKELAETGSLRFFEDLRSEFPAEILELFTLPGLGAKKVKALYEQLQVSSIAQLQEACTAGRVAELPGFGKTTQEKLCQAIAERTKHAGSFRLGAIAAEAEMLQADLRAHPDALHVCIAGSYRRKKEIVRDLDFIVATSAPAEITAMFVQHPLVESIIAQGPTKSSVRLRSGIQCDLRVVSATEYPFALNYFTGSKEHNIVVRNRALQRGWTLNEYRIAPAPAATPRKAKRRRRKSRRCARRRTCIERSIWTTSRRSCGRIAANSRPRPREPFRAWSRLKTFAAPSIATPRRATATIPSRKWPRRRRISDCNTSASPSTVAARFRRADSMLRGCASRSPRSESSIATFDNFRLFAGVECDILRDGALDFDDEILAELDYVVASVHSAFTLSEADMTRRIIRAMSNPFVTMLAHPTGRLLLKRDPYAVDIPAIIEAAAETGTWIEINAAPKRLDLDWRWWPLAKEKGVKCVINPDAHRTERLQELWFGVGVARKGWLTKADVMNCLPLGKIEAELGRKRKGKSDR